MNTNRNTLGPDYRPKQDGREADAYAVACTVCFLTENAKEPGYYLPARHAVALHVISGRLHRLAERSCNTGADVEKAESRLVRAARDIAALYGLSIYHQSDPRGCSLYIGKPEDMNGSTYNRGHAIVRLGR